MIPTLGVSASLERSVGSVLAEPQTSVLLVVDRPRDSVDIPYSDDERVSVMWSGGGAGYAGATQIGIDAALAPNVLLLNDDAWMTGGPGGPGAPGGIAALADALAADPTIAGAAPKISFAKWPEILNSVGTVLHADGFADSRGIGQPDVGQYDARERIFGLHFAAALIRRDLFEPSAVGPLDVSYGAYFEDIDWCLRANLRGYSFVSVAEATATHEQSTTYRQQDFSYRYRLQQRNKMLMALKCFDGRHAAAVLARRTATLLVKALKRDPLSRRGLSAIAGTARMAPAVLRSRSAVQRSRILADAEIFALSDGERSWFTDTSGPLLDVACLTSALRRRGDAPLADEIDRHVSAGEWNHAGVAVSRAPAAASAYWNRVVSARNN